MHRQYAQVIISYLISGCTYAGAWGAGEGMTLAFVDIWDYGNIKDGKGLWGRGGGTNGFWRYLERFGG